MNCLKKNINNLILGWLVGLTICVILLYIPSECEVRVELTSTEQMTEIITEAPTSQVKLLGTFKLTAYCACEKCCGKSDGITATGTKATANRTIAVDKTIIPYGTIVIINGNEYVAEDTGGAIKGNIIDIFFDDHKEALNFGVQYADVYVKG